MNDSLAELHREVQTMLDHLGVDATFPPNCFVSMKAEFLSYEPRQSLTVRMPVSEESLNPLRTMQGGFLAAAFDNAFGPLSYLAARAPCVTLNLTTQFIRPVAPGDQLTIKAMIVSRGPRVLQMSAEAFNRRNKLVALATAVATVVDKFSSEKRDSGR